MDTAGSPVDGQDVLSDYAGGCVDFQPFYKFWYYFVRILVTQIVTSSEDSSSIPSTLFRYLFGWLAFDRDDIPPNSIACLIARSYYIYVTFLCVLIVGAVISVYGMYDMIDFYNNHVRAPPQQHTPGSVVDYKHHRHVSEDETPKHNLRRRINPPKYRYK